MSEVAITDAELVARAKSGDLDSFQALYDRYFARIYDFAYQMVRNREDAADLTSDVFLKAIERLGGLRDPEAFVGWLYAIARNAALSFIDRRKRTTAMPEHLEPTTTAFDDTPALQPSEVAERDELRDLVWQAAGTLDPRQYSIFDLSVRQGLGSGEIAEALGVKPAHAYVLINRMKGSVSEALAAVVLARAGRRDCPELDQVVSRFGDERSPELRKAVSKHLKRCEVCQGQRKRLVSPASLLSGVALAAPPLGLQEEISADLVSAWETAGPGSGAKPLRRRGPRSRSTTPSLVLLFFALLALLAAGSPTAGPAGPLPSPSPVSPASSLVEAELEATAPPPGPPSPRLSPSPLAPAARSPRAPSPTEAAPAPPAPPPPSPIPPSPPTPEPPTPAPPSPEPPRTPEPDCAREPDHPDCRPVPQ